MLIRDINSLKFSSKDSGSPVDADAGLLNKPAFASASGGEPDYFASYFTLGESGRE